MWLVSCAFALRGVHAMCGLTMLTCAGPSPAPPRSATATEDGGEGASRQQEVRPKQRLRSLAGGLTRRQWNTLIDRCCGGPDGELTLPDFKRLLMLSMVPTAQVPQWTDNEIVELWLHLRSIALPEEFTSNGGQGGERTGRRERGGMWFEKRVMERATERGGRKEGGRREGETVREQEREAVRESKRGRQ